MIQGINDDGFINRLWGRGREGANNTIFYLKMTIITFFTNII